MKKIKIKYFDGQDPIDILPNGDWIDLKANETVELKQGEFKLIPLGIAMQLPKGYEAHIVPRSSTFKLHKIIQTNHCGIVDNSYCGSDDQWFMPVYAVEDTKIERGDRICQFRIMKKQPNISFIIVDDLDNPNRGGFGSTGFK